MFARSVHFIKLKDIPPYLADLLPKGTHSYITRNSENIATFQSRTETFKLDLKIGNSSHLVFRN